ncbi:hypothetical protein BXU06_05970 [Aquaspirillum sp. LM1]|uniref:TIR domain-containing protein n=1 Tax=Aquaspirillum sp. LM1 TaxID=1938604 RepID=UPI000983ED95|nr:TIR domain-containing protein [Aquaspirillum sp. LM1]AQR64656.1 hypothetical protein BXU06_05970 [Aquaspirillum sp. LM1]
MSQVFISYRHSDIHSPRVAELAQTLRAAGVNVVIDSDQLPAGPNEGWPKWSQQQVEKADKVLIACTQGWRECYEAGGSSATGLGSAAEAHIVRQILYKTGFNNPKFRIVLLAPDDMPSIPLGLEPFHWFDWHTKHGQAQLLDWLKPKTTPQASVIPWPTLHTPFDRRMANCNDEFQAFEAMLQGHSTLRALLIQGPSGHGKTELANECQRMAIDLGLEYSRIECRGGATLEAVLHEVAVPGFTPCAEDLPGTQRKHWIEACKNLDHPHLLLVDTVEQASEEVKEWLERDVLTHLHACPGLRVVLCGQSIPRRQYNVWRNYAQTFDLQPILDSKVWQAFCIKNSRSTSLPGNAAQFIEALIFTYRGDPNKISPILNLYTERLGATGSTI